MVSISVIIVNYNARYFLRNCIGSILSSDIAEEVEVIVVDNNSSDGSSEMIQRDFPQVNYVQNDENIGFSKANNIGVSLAKGSYVLILNPDTMLTETTLSELLHFSEQQADFGAAGVHFIDGSGKYLPESKRNFPDLKVAGAKLLGYSKYYYANHIGKNEITEIDILTGAFMFIKKKVYKEVGGFDEDFFMYGEDIDLSYRISSSGYKNYYVGSTKVLHFKGESTVKNTFYFRNFYGALSIFYRKHFPNRKALYGLIEVLVSMIITVKSVRVSPDKGDPVMFDTWIYFGNDKQVFEKLKNKYPFSNGLYEQPAGKEFLQPELAFFDSKNLSYTKIIERISDPNFSGVKKRIISADQSFYLGSDASDERGEVVIL
ncbi:glycosyltransferase family 2 protein [Lutimonas vermicola]|uniref:Glycosyltransferase family 2 protein n=1 Tax=Lutimonas vermicola TaxID=414288 RepID=A0ABU9L0D2_9FLAO